MKNKSDVPDTLSNFIHKVGIPHTIHSGNAPETEKGKFRQLCKDYGIINTFTEPYSPWQNRAEGGIHELKRHVYRKMVGRRVPTRLWDFCCKWVSDVKNKTAGNIYGLHDRNPYKATMGKTPDISSLVSFDFYDAIWHYNETPAFPEPKRKVGRWLGEAHDYGQAMCYWLLSDTAQVITRSTVQPIPVDKLSLPETKASIEELDVKIADKLGEVSKEEKYDVDNEDDQLPDYITPEYEPYEKENSMPEADEWDAEAYDQYIFAQVRLPKDGTEVLGKVLPRKGMWMAMP